MIYAEGLHLQSLTARLSYTTCSHGVGRLLEQHRFSYVSKSKGDSCPSPQAIMKRHGNLVTRIRQGVQDSIMHAEYPTSYTLAASWETALHDVCMYMYTGSKVFLITCGLYNQPCLFPSILHLESSAALQLTQKDGHLLYLPYLCFAFVNT